MCVVPIDRNDDRLMQMMSAGNSYIRLLIGYQIIYPSDRISILRYDLS